MEILAALANAVLLFGVAGYVLFEAVRRLDDPPEVASVPVLVVGIIGLAVNLVAFVLLRQGATESLNVRGAYFEVVADTLGSVGVIVAAAVMWATGWGWVDPVIGAAIGLFILPRAWRLGRDARADPGAGRPRRHRLAGSHRMRSPGSTGSPTSTTCTCGP